jgi:hypothetical protein
VRPAGLLKHDGVAPRMCRVYAEGGELLDVVECEYDEASGEWQVELKPEWVGALRFRLLIDLYPSADSGGISGRDVGGL